MPPRPSSDGSSALIREALASDLPRIVALLDQLSLDSPNETPSEPLDVAYHDAFAAMQSDARQKLLVVEAKGVVLGTCSFILVPNLTHRGRPYAIIENVVVDASTRSQGYGEALMRHTIALAQDAGCFKVALTSNLRRQDAHRFYARLGFKPTHTGFRIDF